MGERSKFARLIPVLNTRKGARDRDESTKKKPHFLSDLTLLCQSLCGGNKPQEKLSPEDVSTINFDV